MKLKVTAHIATELTALQVADAAARFLKNTPEGRQADVQRAEEGNGGWAHSGIRYWGNWETPPDVYDDEDYDWQVLTRKSREALTKYVDQIKKQYPGFDIDISTGEKNWIEILVRFSKVRK